TRLDPFDVAGLLAPQGPVARALGAFEDRPSQRDMAAYIADAYNDGGVALLEAGTGVGKSFAYLVPALAWALATGEHTPTFALLKGWRNYVCLARLEQARGAAGSLLEPEAAAEL